MVTATAVSLAVIPVMMRLAPWLGMIDYPDPRKVHAKPVPRVGGWGIVLGALLPIIILVPLTPLLQAYVFGVIALLAFGSMDDRHELGHYTKFIGQLLAVVPVVTYGGVYVTQLPLFGMDSIPTAIGMPFTIFALLGMINAINHSDGLDGLAGGEALLSLGALAFLGYLADSDLILLIALAAMGGGFGFLRYNTHPAIVFMGDGGSQFLGFTLGFLAVLLTQQIHTSLSPAVVLLLLGLPIADILMVLCKRMSQRMNWFLATKNHLHHRLLDLGFVHEESVVIIYSLQTLFVVSGISLRYQPDWLLFTIYVAACVLIFGSLSYAEQHRYVVHRNNTEGALSGAISYLRMKLLVTTPRRFIEFGLPVYLVVTSLLISNVPRDFGFASAGIFVLLLVESSLSSTLRSIMLRALIYVVATFVVYLSYNHPPPDVMWLGLVKLMFLVALAFAIGTAIKYSPRRRQFEFTTTAMDYLMVLIVVTSLVVSQTQQVERQISLFVFEVIILLYACELQIIEKRERWNLLTLSSLATTGVLAVRGLF
ncbi:MAG: undecaprenyl/decaprenyl-phosphate alpha-N-acetylglucosaminyl 1-phosphate transferase [Gammaproteobacteria bacterium]|nr:undecaprenyl/decaprenyl-phosphate alpha-N-acetylglucosaminyl 1-phosphate transferase [Gammaproteobacteria bacterium]